MGSPAVDVLGEAADVDEGEGPVEVVGHRRALEVGWLETSAGAGGGALLGRGGGVVVGEEGSEALEHRLRGTGQGRDR
ncbi:MAG: hypothetical protein U5R31_06500 [Acidimicrobiia bacterium]|nr:hypothetical protein [Acidimicrobiia bacterium]